MVVYICIHMCMYIYVHTHSCNVTYAAKQPPICRGLGTLLTIPNGVEDRSLELPDQRICQVSVHKHDVPNCSSIFNHNISEQVSRPEPPQASISISAASTCEFSGMDDSSWALDACTTYKTGRARAKEMRNEERYRQDGL